MHSCLQEESVNTQKDTLLAAWMMLPVWVRECKKKEREKSSQSHLTYTSVAAPLPVITSGETKNRGAFYVSNWRAAIADHLGRDAPRRRNKETPNEQRGRQR